MSTNNRAGVLLFKEKEGAEYQAAISEPFVYFTEGGGDKSATAGVNVVFTLDHVKVPPGSDAPGGGQFVGSFPFDDRQRINPEDLAIDFNYDADLKKARIHITFKLKGALIPDSSIGV